MKQTRQIPASYMSLWKLGRHIELDTIKGITKPTMEEKAKAQKNYGKFIFEGAFKGMTIDAIEIEDFLGMFSLELIYSPEYTYKSQKNKYNLYGNEERTLFFSCEDGKIGDGGYSNIYSTDFQLGLDTMMKIIGGKTPVYHAKEINIFFNEMANFDSRWIVEANGVSFESLLF
jgi:hypothetical protein